MKGLRIVTTLLLAAGVAGCQAFSPLGTVRTAVIAGVERPQDVPRFRALPYDQMLVRINAGATGRMLLARDERGVQQWLAADGKAFWTRDGRIVASRGLRDDLLGVHALAHLPSPAAVARRPDNARTTHPVYVEAADAPATGLVLEYQLSRRDESMTVQVNDELRRLQQVEERVYHPASGDEWINEYWVDPDSGSTLISAQRLPGTPYHVRLEARSPPTTADNPLPQAAQEAAQ